MKSILALILFALDLWAIIATLGSNESTGKKVLWTLGIVLLFWVAIYVTAIIFLKQWIRPRPMPRILNGRS